MWVRKGKAIKSMYVWQRYCGLGRGRQESYRDTKMGEEIEDTK